MTGNLSDYLDTHPTDLTEWFEKFPWELFEPEIIVTQDTDQDMVIAKRVELETDAEVNHLIICQDAFINAGAEVHGTLVCYRMTLKTNAECNYLITRTAEIQTDAEVKTAIIQDSLTMGHGAEIKELEISDYTFLDLQTDSLIHRKNKRSLEDLNSTIAEGLKLSLITAIERQG